MGNCVQLAGSTNGDAVTRAKAADQRRWRMLGVDQRGRGYPRKKPRIIADRARSADIRGSVRGNLRPIMLTCMGIVLTRIVMRATLHAQHVRLRKCVLEERVIRSGLVSVTFRALAPQAIVDLCARAGVAGIEWGGDVHVPHGDLAQARRVRQMTEDAGLTVASYGSYYRVGWGEPCPFETVLETAQALGAPMIRVWAGKKGSVDANADERDLVVRDSLRCADLAAQEGIGLAYEWHVGTLTDTNESARWLLDRVAGASIKSYWQPPLHTTPAYNLAGLDIVQRCLGNVHVYQWHMDSAERMPLLAGESVWMPYLAKIAAIPGDRFAMLEFVKDDEPDNFVKDSATLKEWLARVAER